MAIATLEKCKPLSAELKTFLQKALKKSSYQKNQCLLKEGDPCDRIWFICSGIVGCFYEKNDRSLCSWFMKETDMVTSVNSFFLQVPSTEAIIALEPVEALYLHRNDLEYIYERYPEFNFHVRELITRYYLVCEQHRRALHNQPSRAKYQYVLNQHPEVIQRLQIKDIAKFLGLHPDVVSKVRGIR